MTEYGSGGIDIHVDNNLAFQQACVNGHFKVAQWLYNLGGVDIHADDDYVFQCASEKGHNEMLQWLNSKSTSSAVDHFPLCK